LKEIFIENFLFIVRLNIPTLWLFLLGLITLFFEPQAILLKTEKNYFS